MAVCDDIPTFERVIDRILGEARALDPSLPAPARVIVDDRGKGPAYAVSTPDHRRRIIDAARLSGLVFDPTTGQLTGTPVYVGPLSLGNAYNMTVTNAPAPPGGGFVPPPNSVSQAGTIGLHP